MVKPFSEICSALRAVIFLSDAGSTLSKFLEMSSSVQIGLLEYKKTRMKMRNSQHLAANDAVSGSRLGACPIFLMISSSVDSCS